MSKTKIEWTGHSWNPITGCTKISEGCKNCYAERMARRLAGRYGYPEQPHHFNVTGHEDKMHLPYQWRKPRTVFVCSMSDLFHEQIQWPDIERIFMVMVKARQHTFQVLTKRSKRMQDFISTCFPDLAECSPHIWLGVSIENQKCADERVPALLQTPAAVRFVSCEPLLEAMSIFEYLGYYTSMDPQLIALGAFPSRLDWVIVGGESGPGARPMHPQWARDIRDQCQAADVPFFFKQHGAHIHESQIPLVWGYKLPWPVSDKNITKDGTGSCFYRVGKKRAGHLLDGQEHREFPT